MMTLEEVQTRLADALASFRKRRGWSYEDVAARVTQMGGKIGAKTIENIEKNATNYEFRHVYWVSRVLGLPLGEMLEFTVEDIDARAQTLLSSVMRMSDKDRVFAIAVLKYILSRGTIQGENSESA